MPEKYVLQGGRGHEVKGKGKWNWFWSLGVWGKSWGWRFGTSLVLNFCEVLKRNASWARFIVS